MKRYALLLLACGALVAAGCGDDNNNKSDSGSSTPAATTPAATTPAAAATTTEAAATTPAADTSNPQVQAAVDACQSSIDNNAQLSAGAKGELKNICKDAASGDEQKVKEASKKVCLKILDETGVTGPAADQAKQACEAVAK
jgi:flagellar motor protein MotB